MSEQIQIDPPQSVRRILARLAAQGAQGYVVGGCVRDSLLGVSPHDWDICTDAPPERVREILGGSWRLLDTGLKHGTVTVLDEAGDRFELTTFRVEGGYSDGRRPDEVHFVSQIEDDLSRRDFTVNAMAYNESRGLVDPFGGRADLARGLLRCVGCPDERFGEDALRILRAVRFAAKLGFEIDPATREAMQKNAPRLKAVSAERIGAELRGILCAPFAVQAVRGSREVLCEVIPELVPMIGCSQNNRYHRADVFGHTMLALENVGRCAEFPSAWADDPLRIALFFHDFGKPSSKTTDPAGHDHFYGHPAVSAAMTEEILRRLRFSGAEIETVTALVRAHDIEFTPTKAHVRRLLGRFGLEQLHRLLKLRECDNGAHSALARQRFEETALPFAALIDEVLAEQSAFSLRDLAVSGSDLLKLGLRPGPQVGQLLNALLDDVVEERLPNEKDALLQRAQALQNAAE